MFCTKCGKTIDDNAAFCNFCGNVINGAAPSAPVEAPPQQAPQQQAPQYSIPQQQAPQQQAPQQQAPQYGAPQQQAPQYGAPQQQAPQYGAPQQQAPQYGAPQQQAPQYGAPQQQAPQYGAPQQQVPQYGAQQGQYGYPAQPGPTLSPTAIKIINMFFKGTLLTLGLLVLIGAIGALASHGLAYDKSSGGGVNWFDMSYGFSNKTQKAYESLKNFVGLARVPAIIAFSFAAIDVVFSVLTKQKSKLTYINAGLCTILFVFNFVMYGCFDDREAKGGFIVACIFLMVGSVGLISSTLLTLLKKEHLLFRPRPQVPPMPPMPPMPPSYPPYQQ